MKFVKLIQRQDFFRCASAENGTRDLVHTVNCDCIFWRAPLKKLVSLGVKEVTLLGQNVNAYHGFFIDEDGIKKVYSLAMLCSFLSKIVGLKRIRYITSHPADMTDELIFEHKKNNNLMPYLHLPIQSGSNKILKDMNRRYITLIGSPPNVKGHELFIELAKLKVDAVITDLELQLETHNNAYGSFVNFRFIDTFPYFTKVNEMVEEIKRRNDVDYKVKIHDSVKINNHHLPVISPKFPIVLNTASK